ncbi:class IV adenylate cyclase [Candidatus Pacearchaeota archaeon]|nr:class IV adenylate cyclase [Candidatus Pacearchaeota archaeon]
MVWLEVETKAQIPISEIQNLRAKIKKIAKFDKKGKKSDDYFAIKRKMGGYPKKAFRIRAMSDKFEVNFKKHLKNHWTKDIVVKQEFEFSLKGKEEVQDLLALFEDLGFKEWVKKIKFNETYKWKKDKKVSIELNNVKNLGWFMELEYLAKPSEMEKARRKLREVLKELEIPAEWIDNTGYTKMLWYKGTKGKKKFID